MKLFLKNGKVPINYTDHTGKTALARAKLLKKKEIVKLLEDAGGCVFEYANNDDRTWIQELKKLQPVERLFTFCQHKRCKYDLPDLKFDYNIQEGQFICILKVKGKEYKTPDYYPSKRKARVATSELVFNELASEFLQEEKTVDSSQIEKLQEYLKDKSTKYDLSDVDYIYDMDNDGNFNCIILLTKNGKVDKEFNLDLHCKSKKEAKNWIARYVYHVLKAEAETLPPASSSETN